MAISRVQVPSPRATDVGASSLSITSTSGAATDRLVIDLSTDLDASTYTITWASANILGLGSNRRTALLDSTGSMVSVVSHSGDIVQVSPSRSWSRIVLFNNGDVFAYASGQNIVSLVKGSRTIDATPVTVSTQRATLTGINANHFSFPTMWGAIGDIFYAIHSDAGNQTSAQAPRLVSFNNATNTWTVLAAFPYTGTNNSAYGMSGGTLGTAFHAMGGGHWTGSQWQGLAQHHRYDPGSNTWSARSTASFTPVRDGAVFSVSATNLYYLGGLDFTGNVANVNQSYDQTANTWTSRANGTNVLAWGNHYASDGSTAIYAIDFNSQSWTYTVSTNTWSNNQGIRSGLSNTGFTSGKYFRSSGGNYFLYGVLANQPTTLEITNITTANPFASNGTVRRRIVASGVSSSNYHPVPGSTVIFSAYGGGGSFSMFTMPLTLTPPPSYLQ